MNEDFVDHKDNIAVSQVKKHQLTTFLVASIGVALFLVFIALSLYKTSGTMQLDLSRPGFDQARKEATKDNEVFEGFPAEGEITANSLKKFNSLYTEELNDATAIDAYAGDALSDKTLQLQAN